jgi:hypothetical protein
MESAVTIARNGRFTIKRNEWSPSRGIRSRDAFASLKKTCRKLGISFWDYLHDRIGQIGAIPPLPDIVREKALAGSAVP